MYTTQDKIQIPAVMMPGFRTTLAIQNKVERNLLVRTWGGLGDEICAEPTLRYMLEEFRDCKISLAAERPELFTHLKFERVFDLKVEHPIWDDYLVFQTITPPDDSNLVWQFFSHMLTHCVDFTSMCALRMQLPNARKEIKMEGVKPKGIESLYPLDFLNVFVHPGKHWPSKTFPKNWWDAVLAEIIRLGATPVIIGSNAQNDNRGTVDVNTDGCIDLRDKLSVKESIWILQRARVLLTNDSSPLHMAASGDAWIGFVATCKHPDYITHWRKGQFGWRQKNFGKGGIWDVINNNPNAEKEVTAEFVEESLLRSWLPDPVEFATWAVEKTKE